MTIDGLSVSAPGKAIVCGEYAVLDGAPAICVAVDRHVVARPGPGMKSPFVEAALRHAGRALGRDPLSSVSVDSAPLYEATAKIGLGSSAAVTTAVVGLAFAAAGRSLEDRAQLFAIADAAHAEAQGVVGSGIDVATSVYGGAIRFQRGTDVQIAPVAWPSALALTFVFSGQSASTADLVGRVRKLRERDAATYDTCMGALAELAKGFSAALERGDAMNAIAVAARWQPALRALGRAADAPIVTPFFDEVAAIAHEHGAAAKPSGAGGGDLGVILSLGDCVSSLHAALARKNIHTLSLVPHGPARGLSLSHAPEHSR
ncbi:MAG: hypothetical protein ABI321_20305 [Polyangia bacterium]